MQLCEIYLNNKLIVVRGGSQMVSMLAFYSDDPS